ncbi:hypothetical protein [Methylocella sp.]|uniref:hypothetical protein n=1 Tax=Methylocella sp. TaxID=1978226 RepID=UPI003782D473
MGGRTAQETAQETLQEKTPMKTAIFRSARAVLACAGLVLGAASPLAGCAASYHPYGWPAGAPAGPSLAPQPAR